MTYRILRNTVQMLTSFYRSFAQKVACSLIGIAYAEKWVEKPLRFVLVGKSGKGSLQPI
jgi:hypothetical protein